MRRGLGRLLSSKCPNGDHLIRISSRPSIGASSSSSSRCSSIHPLRLTTITRYSSHQPASSAIRASTTAAASSVGHTAEESYEARVKTEEEARREEANKAWRAAVLSDALLLLRAVPEAKEAPTNLSHRQALLTLGHLASHLTPKDALLLIHQALDQKLGKVAFNTLVELQKKDMDAVLGDADALIKSACAAGKFRLAIMVMEEVQNHPGCKPPSREAFLALVKLLTERNRFKDYWSFAEQLVSRAAGVEARVSTDVEVIGTVMVICWKARKWISIQRLLLDSLVAKGALAVPKSPPEQGRAERTAPALEALVEKLRQKKVLKVEHCNMLLNAYLAIGKVDLAIAFVQRMGDHDKGKGIPSPDARSLALVMDALGKLGRWEECLALMNRVKELGVGIGHVGEDSSSPRRGGSNARAASFDVAMVYKTAIAALGKMGMWEGALSLFYEMHEKGIKIDPQVYTTLFKALKTGHRWETALSFLEVMKQQHVTPSRMTYNVILSALGTAGQIDKALELFNEMRSNGLFPTTYEYGTLISACGRVGKVDEAYALLKEAEALCDGVDGEGRGEERSTADAAATLANCYTQMLKAFGTSGRWEAAVQLLHEMRLQGKEPHFTHYYETMRGCAKAGQCDMTLQLLEEVADRFIQVHILCWNAATNACKTAGRWQDALKLLEQMQCKGIEPGHINYARVMATCGEGGAPEKALEVLESMYSRGWQPDRATYGTLMQVCGGAGMWERVVALIKEEMMAHGVKPDRLSYVHAASALLACDKMDEAVHLITQEASALPSPLAFHLVMIALVGKNGNEAASKCQGLLETMVERHGLIPDAVTEAIMHHVNGEEGRAAVGAYVGGSSGSGGLGTQGEMRLMTFEEAKVKVQEQSLLNPHDDLKRMRVDLLGSY